jgi:hypothetical protein
LLHTPTFDTNIIHLPVSDYICSMKGSTCPAIQKGTLLSTPIFLPTSSFETNQPKWSTFYTSTYMNKLVMIGGSRFGRGWEFFSSPPCPDRLWGPPSLRGRDVITTHLHLGPMSRMPGAISPLPHYAFMVWCSVKAQGQLYDIRTAPRPHLGPTHPPIQWVPGVLSLG